MKYPHAVLSDADGTLVNTVRLIRHGQYETAKAYLLQRGLPPEAIPSYATYEGLLNRSVGASARDTLERTVRLLYREDPHHLEGLDFGALHDMLNPVQDRLAPEFVTSYTGLSEFFSRLGTLGIKLAIFSSGTPHHIVRNFGIALSELGLAGLHKDAARSDIEKLRAFEATVQRYYDLPAFTVITCDDHAAHKPDPEGMLLAMRRLDAAPAGTWVLGDHAVDMQAGLNAGVPERIGVTHGFDDRSTLEAAGATRVIDSLAAFFDTRS